MAHGEGWATEFFPEIAHLQMMPDDFLEHFQFHDQSSLPLLESFYADVKMEEESAGGTPNPSSQAPPQNANLDHGLISQIPSPASVFRSWMGSVENHEVSCSTSSSEARPAEQNFTGKKMFRRIVETHRSAYAQVRAATIRPRQQEQQQAAQAAQAALQNQNENDLTLPPRSGYNHMVAERNRRSKEKQLMGILRSFIPSSGTKKIKGDKISTLKAVIDHISQLKCQVAQLEQQNQELEESQSATMKIDRDSEEQEMDRSSKSSDSLSQTLDPAFMVTGEDETQISSSSSSMQLRFDMTNRMKPAHELLIEVLTFLKHLGLKLESIDWLKASSILSITVHSTMDSCPITRGQLREELEKRLFLAAPSFREDTKNK